jgi:hydrogenase expression/formation protein HypC
MGKIDFGGVVREVCLSFVPEAQVGDYALIHVGFALNLMSEQEAQETLDLLRQIADLDEELQMAAGSGVPADSQAGQLTE